MIYFDDELRTRVHALLHESLAHLGVLCLGTSETIHGTAYADRYEAVASEYRIYRKCPAGTSRRSP
jgi:chemotaxis protein methyltransferase CheR